MTAAHKKRHHHHHFGENTMAHAKTYWHKTVKGASKFAKEVRREPHFTHSLNLAKTHPKEAFFIALMVIGILLSFFHYSGGLIVGLGAALCLPWTITDIWSRIYRLCQEKGRFLAWMIGLSGLFLLFQVPSFIIGGLIGFCFNMFLRGGKKNR